MIRFALAAVLALAACSPTGMGDAARKDVAARMQTVQPGVATCYEEALKRNRELRGTIVLKFAVEPKTGKFVDVKVLRTDLADDALQACVTEQVSALKLEKPTSTRLSIEYPLEFAPLD
jgi:hypothetical protein